MFTQIKQEFLGPGVMSLDQPETSSLSQDVVLLRAPDDSQREAATSFLGQLCCRFSLATQPKMEIMLAHWGYASTTTPTDPRSTPNTIGIFFLGLCFHWNCEIGLAVCSTFSNHLGRLCPLDMPRDGSDSC